MPASDKRREIASMLRGVMLTAATQNSLQFLNWSQFTIGHNQLYDNWIGRGLCQGLSAKYLACTRAGQDFTRTVDFQALQVPGQYERTELHEEIFNAAIAGNVGENDREELVEFMSDEYNFRHVRSESIKPHFIGSSSSRFADFVTGKSHYYMISVPGHALAAVATGAGYHFFDPNCGIARGDSGSKMRKFLTSYFRHEYVKRWYGHGHSIPYEVSRFS